jgi:hypothetical protein
MVTAAPDLTLLLEAPMGIMITKQRSNCPPNKRWCPVINVGVLRFFDVSGKILLKSCKTPGTRACKCDGMGVITLLFDDMDLKQSMIGANFKPNTQKGG